MADTALEILKTIGSISGIFAAAFLIWDRYTKHFPLAIIVAQPLMPGSQNIVLFLGVANFSDRPILVSWKNKDVTRFRIGKSQSVRGVLETLFEDETTVALGPKQEVFLPLFKPTNFDNIDPDNPLEINLRWRFAQPRIWTADRKIRVWVRKRDLDHMVNNYTPKDASDDD